MNREEAEALRDLAGSRTAATAVVQRARIIHALLEDPALSAGAAARRVGFTREDVGPVWARRFNAGGVAALHDAPRAGRPPTHTADVHSRLIALAVQKLWVHGAFEPATGAALTQCYARRTTANWIDFLGRVDRWVPNEVGRVYAILDNLSPDRATDVLLFSLAHPRWEFVFQPVSAAYLNLVEPWSKVLRSLARKGRRFETWAEIERAITGAAAYWNAHRHPFVWGHRRRHRPRRSPGIALTPAA